MTIHNWGKSGVNGGKVSWDAGPYLNEYDRVSPPSSERGTDEVSMNCNYFSEEYFWNYT